jgi:arginyl-tRNA synthetase
VVANPFAEFRQECQAALSQALKTALPEVTVDALPMGKPSNPNFGQLASSVSFELAKKLKQKPADLAAQLAKAVDSSQFKLIGKVEPAGGYVNFHVNWAKFSALTIESIKQLDKEYGFVKTDAPANTALNTLSLHDALPIYCRHPLLH